MNQKNSNRKRLIQYIKKQDGFYKWANFEGHSNEQLYEIAHKYETHRIKILKAEIPKN